MMSITVIAAGGFPNIYCGTMPSPEAVRRAEALEVSDRRLFERLHSGDPTAFETLFREYAARLCAFAFGYVESKAVAEELVQDLFCWLWDHRVDAATPVSVRAYLFAALRNRALNHVRRERVVVEFGERVARAASRLASLQTADADLLAGDLASALAAAVHAMPLRCREVFSLVRDQHLTYAEVAEVLGISPKTVEI